MFIYKEMRLRAYEYAIDSQRYPRRKGRARNGSLHQQNRQVLTTDHYPGCATAEGENVNMGRGHE